MKKQISMTAILICGLFNSVKSQSVLCTAVASNTPSSNESMGDRSHSLVKDNNGDLITIGKSILSTNDNDYFISKSTANCSLIWTVTYDGTGNGVDEPMDVAVDNNNDIYVIGRSKGSGQDMDMLTLKLNAGGVQQWTNRYNANMDLDFGTALDISKLTQEVIVTGWSVVAPDQIFTKKINPATGATIWTQFFISVDEGVRSYDVTTDNAGNIYVAGEQFYKDIPTNTKYSKTLLLKYDDSGNFLWSQEYYGTLVPSSTFWENSARKVKVDNSGNVFICGVTTNSANQDVLLIKYDSGGNMIWNASYDRNNSLDYANDMAFDLTGNIGLTGYSAFNYNATGPDLGIYKIDQSGNWLWATFYDGPTSGSLCHSFDIGWGIDVDECSNNFWVCGEAMSVTCGIFNYITLICDNSTGAQLWIDTYSQASNQAAVANSLVVSNATGFVAGYAADASNKSSFNIIKYGTVAPTLSINPPDPCWASGNNPTLTASTGFLTYLWNTGATTPSISANAIGTYTVTVTYDASGCTISASVIVAGCCNNNNNELVIGSPIYSGGYDLNSSIIIPNGTTVSFNNCNIDIYAGMTITVDPYATLIITNNSHLYACGDMWQGIILTDATSTLQIDQNSEIEDAENAVFANSGGTIRLDNALFDHNFISVNLSNGDYSGSYIGNNCRFQCSNGYSLKYPHLNERTSDQILLTRVLGITIGDINAQYNSFSDADKGIHGEVSNADIYNNEFTNFTDNTVTGVLAYAVYMNKVPLLANIGAVGQQNYFTDNSIAAYVTQSAPPSNIHIDGNIFYNCGEGAYIVNNPLTRLITASDNEMDYMYDGVNAFGNDDSYLFIERNRITTFNSGPTPDGGIIVGDLHQTFEQSFHTVIDNNVIHSYGNYGIYLSKADNADVYENRVYMNHINLQASVFGIRADQSAYSTFQCNEVDENANDKKHKIGFRYFDLLREAIMCNTADGNGFGMQFIGNILKTNIRANVMQNSNHGFVIGSAPTIMNGLTNFYNTTTAQQEVPGNMWPIGTNLYDTYNFNQPQVPALETHNPSGFPDWPLNNGHTAFDPAISPFQLPLIPLFDCGANGIICNIPQLPAGEHDTGSFNMQFAQQIALNTLPAMSADEVTAWKARKTLYVNLRKDTILQNSSAILTDFYDSLTTENIGRLTDVDDLISQATDSSVANDSIFIAGKVNDANAINDNISSTVMPEFNTKVVNEICLNMIGEKRSVLTSAEFNDALMVGSQCIFEGGPAVIIARNLVHTQNPFVLFNDEDLCSNFTFRTAGKENKTNTSSGVFVSPNPAKESITFAYDKIEEGSILVIKDIAGRVIEEIVISANSFSYKLNLSNYGAGSYFYEIKNKNVTGRFEVVK